MPAPNVTDTNFERTFSDLAYARLRDKAPTLLDYLVGFQLVDKNDEGTHAVGVFGFKVGSEWIYCPVFFINGELKGHELMYIKSQDAFVPMDEQWTNYILNRRPRVLGELEPTPRNRLGLRQPDFDIFARSPYIGSKYASAHRTYSDICSMLERHNPDFLPAMNMFVTGPKATKFAALSESFTLPGAIKSLGKQAGINLLNTMTRDHKFAESVLSFYDVQSLIESAEQAQEAAQKRAAARAASHSKVQPFAGLKTASELDEVSNRRRRGPFTFPKAVVITRGDDGSNVMQDLSEADKSKLMREQYVVKDPRTADQKSRLYRSQMAVTLNSPFKTGLYEALLPTGETRRVLIVQQPRRLGWAHTKQDSSVLVVDPESKRYGNFQNADILTSKWLGTEEMDKFFDGLPDAKSIGMDDYAVLLGPNCAGTNVFRVENVVKHPDGRTELKVWGYNQPAPSANLTGQHRSALSPVSDHETENADTILFTNKDDIHDIQQVGRTLFVPNGWKALVLKSGGPKRPRVHIEHPPSGDAEFGLGRWSDLLMNMKKVGSAGGLTTLQVLTDGIRFTPVVGDKQMGAMTKVAALKYLIEGQGLDQEDAEAIIKEAEPRQKVTYWVKYAYGEPPTSAVFNEPRFGDEYGIKAPIQYPQTEIQNLSQNDNLGARELYRNDRFLDYDAKQYATLASNLGQKEVLDTAVITGLVKTMDTDSAVDSYISDLLLGLDRVGRILFMYYWHNDKFKERYGQQDMVELEDNLRNVFKNLGELTLFLKQKTVEPEQAEGSEVKLDEVTAP